MSTGSYTLSGSGLLTAAGEALGEDGGVGSFLQSGGTNSVSGVLQIGANCSYSLNGGVLLAGGIQGTGALSLGGGTLVANAAFSTSQAIALTGSGGNASINTAGYQVTLSGPLSGLGGLTKLGNGTLVLCNADSYAGVTTIAGGALKLDFSQSTAPASNIVNNGADVSALALGGGALVIQGKLGAGNSQVFNGLTVNPALRPLFSRLAPRVRWS